MFSISQTSRGFFCLEWSSTENGPKVVSTNHIKVKKNFSNISLLEEIISNYNITIKNESNSLSVIVSSDEVIISSLDTSPGSEVLKTINWYESNIMGKEYCDKYYNFYYPMSCNDKLLIVSFPKIIKNNLLKSSSNLGFNLIYLSVDIFSTAMLVQNFYKKYIKDKYILWKVDNNNKHIIIVYKNELICSYTIVKKQSNKYVKSYGIGNDDDIKKSVDCVNCILVNKKKYNDIEKIFVYQTKEDKTVINNILNLKDDNVKPISIDDLLEHKTNNTNKNMQYVENGICFKGLDL